MGDHVERQDTTTPKIPKWMCCGHDTNINLTVIRPTLETITLWKQYSVPLDRMFDIGENKKNC
jgi:hypothetical protein